MSSTWGEFLRLRGRAPRARAAGATEAYHDFGQSVSVFDLLGEQHQAGLEPPANWARWPRPPGRDRARRAI